MMKHVRELRLIPIVLLATASLAVLKVLGLLLDGGYLLTDLDGVPTDRPIHVENDAATVADNKVSMPQSASSRALQTLGFQDVTGATAAGREAPRNAERNAQPDSTGNSPEAPAKPSAKPEKPPDGKVIPVDTKPAPSASERAILERLQERRQELDARGREIELRENLLKAAEKKYESRANELRDQEANASAAQQKKEEAEAARLKNIVTMYENMKAKDAARIFDRLDMRILVEVASQINPRRMSDILGQMSAEAAERLTVELANRATTSSERNLDAGNLPKIEGIPKN
jgi:flagellar motility protein MotE (MotC chaperone)